MLFAKRLREGVRRGRITCSVRIWISPRVKVGAISLKDVTYDLTRESGFDSVNDLLKVAKHGRGRNVYLIRFHYLPPGGWDTPKSRQRHVGRR